MGEERCAEGVLKRKEIEFRKSVIHSRRVAATVDEKSSAAAPEIAAQSDLGMSDVLGWASIGKKRPP